MKPDVWTCQVRASTSPQAAWNASLCISIAKADILFQTVKCVRSNLAVKNAINSLRTSNTNTTILNRKRVKSNNKEYLVLSNGSYSSYAVGV